MLVICWNVTSRSTCVVIVARGFGLAGRLAGMRECRLVDRGFGSLIRG